MACLPFTVLIFQLVFFAQVSERHYEVNHCHTEENGRLQTSWLVLRIFFVIEFQEHVKLAGSLSAFPCVPLVCWHVIFQVVFGNLKPVRDCRCRALHGCCSFGRVCSFKTTKATSRNLRSLMLFLSLGMPEHLLGLLDFPVQPGLVLPFYSTEHEGFRLETPKLILWSDPTIKIVLSSI